MVMNAPVKPNSFRSGPDENGRFGIYGGRFVAETLMPNILELEAAYNEARNDPAYLAEMAGHQTHFIGPGWLDSHGQPTWADTEEVATGSLSAVCHHPDSEDIQLP